MKKIIILIVATLLCLGTFFAGCGGTGYNNKLAITGEVSSNGGFAVVKGDYVYYINGVEAHTSDNTYGEVVAGALVRTKKADIGTENASAEVVIPQLLVAGSFDAGFYIYGEHFYYASPRSEKNKEGEIENTKLDFFKTTLNGKTAKNLITIDDNTTNYRFIELSNTVYLVLETVNASSEKSIKVVDTSNGKEYGIYLKKEESKTSLKVLDASSSEAKELKVAGLESVVFGEDGSIFFTRIAYNDELEQNEAFNELYRFDLGSIPAVQLVLEGKGAYVGGEFNIQGANISIVKNLDKALVLKTVSVESDVTAVTHYYTLNKANIDANDSSANKAKLVEVNNGTATASAVFTENSLYQYDEATGEITVVYLDATFGLLKYDLDNKEANDYRSRLFYDEDLVGYTVQFWHEGYVYLTDTNSYYYRVNVGALLDEDTTNDEIEVEQITCLTASTSWYAPEIVGDYLLLVYTSSPYNSMVFAAKNEALTEEAIEKIQTEDRESVEANLKLRLGILTDSAKEAIETYLNDTFGEELEGK